MTPCPLQSRRSIPGEDTDGQVLQHKSAKRQPARISSGFHFLNMEIRHRMNAAHNQDCQPELHTP